LKEYKKVLKDCSKIPIIQEYILTLKTLDPPQKNTVKAKELGDSSLFDYEEKFLRY
jgi:hypothetical protein